MTRTPLNSIVVICREFIPSVMRLVSLKRGICLAILCSFLLNSVGANLAFAQEIRLPAPGVMVHLSPAMMPPMLKGVTVDANNPFRFDFILDKGDAKDYTDSQLKEESKKLVKYF